MTTKKIVENSDKIYTIKIFGKEYHVKCEPHEHGELDQCARILDNKMRVIRKSGKVIGPEKIAITAALNIARDLLKEYNKKVEAAERAQAKINRLEQKLAKLREKV